MSDAHHDHGLPPPQPDNVPVGRVVFWGLGSFFSVVAVIILLGGYFWTERGNEDEVKIAGVPGFGVEFNEANATAKANLEGYKKLPDGSYQIPIERAMELLARQPSIN